MQETNIRKTELYVPPIVSSTGLTPKGLYFTIPEAFREETHRNIENDCAHWRNAVANPLEGALYRIRRFDDGRSIGGNNDPVRLSAQGLYFSMRTNVTNPSIGGGLRFNVEYHLYDPIGNRNIRNNGGNFRFQTTLVNKFKFLPVNNGLGTGLIGSNPFVLVTSPGERYYFGKVISGDTIPAWYDWSGGTNHPQSGHEVFYLSE